MRTNCPAAVAIRVPSDGQWRGSSSSGRSIAAQKPRRRRRLRRSIATRGHAPASRTADGLGAGGAAARTTERCWRCLSQTPPADFLNVRLRDCRPYDFMSAATRTRIYLRPHHAGSADHGEVISAANLAVPTDSSGRRGGFEGGMAGLNVGFAGDDRPRSPAPRAGDCGGVAGSGARARDQIIRHVGGSRTVGADERQHADAMSPTGLGCASILTADARRVCRGTTEAGVVGGAQAVARGAAGTRWGHLREEDLRPAGSIAAAVGVHGQRFVRIDEAFRADSHHADIGHNDSCCGPATSRISTSKLFVERLSRGDCRRRTPGSTTSRRRTLLHHRGRSTRRGDYGADIDDRGGQSEAIGGVGLWGGLLAFVVLLQCRRRRKCRLRVADAARWC